MPNIPISVGVVDNAELFSKVLSGGWFGHEKLQKTGMEVIRRSKFTCAGCGFVSRTSKQVPHGYMVPVNTGQSGFVANTVKGSVCLCPMCASTLGINASVSGVIIAGNKVDPAGMLLALPSVDQVSLNRLALHTVSILSSKSKINDKLATAARHIDSTMVSCHSELSATFPFHRNDDSSFARALALLPAEHYALRNETIAGLRWWPVTNYWSKQGAYWRQATYKRIEENSELGELC